MYILCISHHCIYTCLTSLYHDLTVFFFRKNHEINILFAKTKMRVSLECNTFGIRYQCQYIISNGYTKSYCVLLKNGNILFGLENNFKYFIMIYTSNNL